METAPKSATLLETRATIATTHNAPAPTIWDRPRKTLQVSGEWLADSALSIACLAIAAGGVWFALSIIDADANIHYAKKWLLCGSLLLGIIGVFWGGSHTQLRTKLGATLILTVLTGVFLHAGLIDSEWQKTALSPRLALTATGVGFALLGCAILMPTKKAMLFVGALAWLWAMGWLLFFLITRQRQPASGDGMALERSVVR